MEWIIVGVVALLAIFLIITYNQLVKLANRYKNLFSQIDIQLQRRYDLIPNLVESAKGYLQHERETLEAVTSARNQAMGALTMAKQNPGSPAVMAQLGEAEGMLGAALGRLNMVMEAYPDLKASQNMMQLSEELVNTENLVAFARQAYNDSVQMFNTKRQSFPAVMVAGMFGFADDAALLEMADRKVIQDAPRVSF
ncbi:LemA family protein [Marinobacterium sp. BA1]|uniref:LemA family protein n=1 Tax=Marinobacterium sp. BA1 TaxID=3138931 RepID=UPI0032E7EB14